MILWSSPRTRSSHISLFGRTSAHASSALAASMPRFNVVHLPVFARQPSLCRPLHPVPSFGPRSFSAPTTINPGSGALSSGSSLGSRTRRPAAIIRANVLRPATRQLRQVRLRSHHFPHRPSRSLSAGRIVNHSALHTPDGRPEGNRVRGTDEPVARQSILPIEHDRAPLRVCVQHVNFREHHIAPPAQDEVPEGLSSNCSFTSSTLVGGRAMFMCVWQPASKFPSFRPLLSVLTTRVWKPPVHGAQ